MLIVRISTHNLYLTKEDIAHWDCFGTDRESLKLRLGFVKMTEPHCALCITWTL